MVRPATVVPACTVRLLVVRAMTQGSRGEAIPETLSRGIGWTSMATVWTSVHGVCPGSRWKNGKRKPWDSKLSFMNKCGKTCCGRLGMTLQRTGSPLGGYRRLRPWCLPLQLPQQSRTQLRNDIEGRVPFHAVGSASRTKPSGKYPRRSSVASSRCSARTSGGPSQQP